MCASYTSSNNVNIHSIGLLYGRIFILNLLSMSRLGGISFRISYVSYIRSHVAKACRLGLVGGLTFDAYAPKATRDAPFRSIPCWLRTSTVLGWQVSDLSALHLLGWRLQCGRREGKSTLVGRQLGRKHVRLGDYHHRTATTLRVLGTIF